MLFFFFDDGGTTFIGLDPGFGLFDAEQREGTRAVGPLISIWFVIFMIPFFMWVKEGEKPNIPGGFRQSMIELKMSLLGMLKRPSLFSFMGAQMFYRDALNGLYAFGGRLCCISIGLGLNAAWYFWDHRRDFQQPWLHGFQEKYDKRLGPKTSYLFSISGY